MTTVTLRPLSLGELLDTSFALYRQLFPNLVFVALATGALPQAIGVYIDESGGLALHPLLWLGNLVLSVVLGAVGVGASTHIVSASYLGDWLNAGAALGRVVPQIGAIIALSIITTCLVAFGLVFLIVPGLILAAGLTTSTTALVLEQIGDPVRAMKRSWELTRGHRGRVLVALAMAFLLMIIPPIAIGAVAAILGLELLLSVAAVALTLLLSPFLYVTVTVLYYDLRVRKEGFDLEMLAREVHG